MVKKVGIMGGTFNPIHVGHLMLAENAYAYCNLDEIWFMPSADPPHKTETKVLEYAHRSRMTELAIADIPYFKKTDFEAERHEPSYTAETLRLLHTKYPDVDFYFIMGADSLFQIETWYEPARVMEQAALLVAVRDHHSKEEMIKQMDYLIDKYHARIYLVDMPGIDLSSNMIRQRASNNETIRFFVTESVRQYILEHNLYDGE
ncbi:MAG: nicotinate-nucleotide adenylyltransferase [Frisingicoccus sp.]|nr:nicotinate-nucleotide adenylyltransferase [Frisingicoccus sp.]